jgi:hypothetical protein
MAKEIQVIAHLVVKKGSLSVEKPATSLQIDMAGSNYSAGVQSIGFAAHEQVDVNASVATPGVAKFTNLDAANFVRLGRDVAGAFVAFAKLMPGEFWLGRLDAGDVYAQADTAAVSLEHMILEA